MRFALSAICLILFTISHAKTPGENFPHETGESPPSAEAQKVQDLTELSLEDLLNKQVETVSKIDEKMSDAPGIVSVITREELERFGGMTLKDVMERVPGLFVASDFMTDRTLIGVRGDQIKNTGAHTLILINGRPTREVVQGGISTDIYQSFPVEIIEQIEVVKGPGSVLYGTDAFSGVINIVTRKAKASSLTARCLSTLPSGYSASGEGMLKEDDLSILTAGGYIRQPDWTTTYSASDFFTRAPYSTEVTVPNHGYGAFFDVKCKGLQLMSLLTQWRTSSFQAQGPGTVGWGRQFTDMGYGREIMKHWQMDFNVTYTRHTLSLDNAPNISRESHFAVGEWTNNVDIMDNVRLLVGGEYDFSYGREYDSTVNPTVTYSDEKRSAIRFYTQASYEPLKSLKFIGGVQVNKVKNLAWNMSPRAGIIWYPLPVINVKALYSQAFRAPSINEIGLRAPAPLQGNPNLRHEQVRTIDIGVSYLGEKVQGGIGCFDSRQSDIVVSQFTPGVIPGFHSNLGKLEIRGVEADVKYYPLREVFLTGSGLYQTNKDQDGQTDVTPLPPIIAKAGISYKSDKGMTTGLFYVFGSKLDKRFNSTFTTPSPCAYHSLDFHAKLSLVKLCKVNYEHDIAVITQVNNLLNRQVWLPSWTGEHGATIPMNWGIDAYLGVEVGF
jgi:outer membrane receptor for ferrienterochelin and colicins